ncbi:MAG: polysaccharide export protein [Methylobacteriaceae bacterium]|nr:polysaccharide export protein [Methylobacteriaceae bacterium]
MRAIVFAAGAALAVGGCSAIPSAGPTAGDVIEQGAPQAEGRYAIVEVDDRTVQLLRGRAADASLTSFGDYRGSVEPRVGVGDVVSLTIWEAGAGGLFSPSLPTDRFVPGSRAANIPEQLVGRDGTITVPYAGRVRAAGRSTFEIQREIERALEGKAIQPQVLVSVTKPLSSTVTVLGEASAAARLPISPRGDRVLDVIAQAGGVRAPINESFIQLTRGARTARVAMSRVAANARENIYVRPGDVLTVIRDPQMFLAAGATGRNAEIPFDAEGITLAQALSKAGGLLDYRADPEGVFVFRLEPERIARSFDEARHLVGRGGTVKVVYRINLRDPNGMFLASQFRIFNRDLVYVSNAPLTDAQKVLQLFNLIVSPVSSGASIVSVTR